MDGAGHCRLHGRGPVARSDPEARSPTSLHCRLCRLVRQGGPHQRRSGPSNPPKPTAWSLVDAGLGREELRQRALRHAPRLPCVGCSFFLLASHCAVRHACPQAKTRTLARAPTIDGRTTRRAVRRHGCMDHCTTGEYGAHAHRCGGPPSSRPLSPSPYNAIYVKPNSKRPGTAPGDRFAKYQSARSVSEYLKLGGTKSDLANDLKKGIVTAIGRPADWRTAPHLTAMAGILSPFCIVWMLMMMAILVWCDGDRCHRLPMVDPTLALPGLQGRAKAATR